MAAKGDFPFFGLVRHYNHNRNPVKIIAVPRSNVILEIMNAVLVFWLVLDLTRPSISQLYHILFLHTYGNDLFPSGNVL